MIEQVSKQPEIWRVQITLPNNPLRHTNSYFIRSGDETLIIDTGFMHPESQAAMQKGLDFLEVDPARAKVFITHLHSDHTGLSMWMHELGCEIIVIEQEFDYLTKFIIGTRLERSMDRMMRHGFPPEEIEAQYKENPAVIYNPEDLFPVTTLQPDELFTVGGHRYQCVSTPGHTPFHSCLYMPDYEVMFLGDHILFDITPNITTWTEFPDALSHYLESLDIVKDYPIKLALPGHRSPDGDVYKRAEAIKKHHEERLDEIYDVIKAQPGQNAYTVASKIKWHVRSNGWHDFPVSQKWFAVTETLAHIDLLVLCGRAEKTEQEGSIFFTAKE